ncbi:hypothetical protein KIF59_06060 [Enterobacter cloacae subsp. cloacae]|nr:hypothetical protein [Enterobacter cloacae subsp. cloacae]
MKTGAQPVSTFLNRCASGRYDVVSINLNKPMNEILAQLPRIRSLPACR